MAQKNDTPVLILALLLTLGLIGGGLWFFGRPFLQQISSGSPKSETPQADRPPNLPLDERLSGGERVIAANPSAAKQQGVQAFVNQDYRQAETDFQATLKTTPNDPEALIYLNNARAAATGNAYTLAIAVPMGSDANSALEMLRGIAQVQDEINQQGGISGKLLKVVIADDGGDPEIAKQVAQKLVDDAEVLGVVGHFSSGASLAAGEIYERGGLVMISPVSTSTELTNFGKFIFRTVPSDFVAARALADYMTSTLRRQKAAVFYNSQSKYSQSLRSEFVAALGASPDGGEIVEEFDFSTTGFSPRSSYDRAVQVGADILVLLPNSDKLDQALQLVQLNQKRLKIIAGDDVYSAKTLEIGKADAEGLVVAVPWHILSDPQSRFVQSSRQLWRADVSWRTAMSYDAAVALVDAIRRNPNREGIRNSLTEPDFAPVGATGTVKFRSSGDRNQRVQLVTVEPGDRSGFAFDFVPVKR